MRTYSVQIAAWLLASVTAAFPQSPKAEALKHIDQATIRRLEKDIPDLMQKGNVPGMSVALIKDGKTYWTHGFGVKNAKTKQPVTNDTIFEAASLSKPVFAYAVLKLVDQGKIDLDAPLTKYLRGTYDVKDDDRINQITARFVLSHRTGFRNWRNNQPLKIYFAPGERFSYSGEGFVYLSKVVEHITGEPLNEFMKRTVFVPLGMTSSSYLWRPDFDERAATGHDVDENVRAKGKPDQVNAAASLHTTAADYARFMEAVLNGTGLKPATWKEMLTPQIAVDPECTNCTDRAPGTKSTKVFWGLGVGMERTASGDSFWHWGDNGAFKCFMVAYPKQKTGLVMFTNSENGLSIHTEIVEDALGGQHPAFAWAKYDDYDAPAARFYAVVRKKGADAGIAQFQDLLRSDTVSESSLNSLGYRLLSQKKVADAIKVFSLNVERFPKSGNVYDSLGEAYMNNGDKKLAIKNYEKSLEVDPTNSNATEMLKKLRQ
jgi:CubicO group peptidase (beta-lactamase class C family)